MFGHLKAEHFLNLMEGAKPPAMHKAHLDSCAICRETWESLKLAHAEVTSMDAGMSEPDWAQFRSSVRDQLLSRSIQRSSTMRRWTGWAIRPAMAWVLSLLLAVGIPTGALLWHLENDRAATENSQPMYATESTDVGAGNEKTVFDDLIQLNDSEQEQFQKMLEAARKDSLKLQ
jgi:type II secretory pathway component PulL